MNFLKKLFGNANEESEKEKKSGYIDNNKLIRLLDAWGRQESQHTYMAVVHELLEGQSHLLLPTVNDDEEKISEYKTLDAGTTINLTSVTTKDGVTVIDVFGNEEALFGGRGKNTQYTIMPAQDVFAVCEEQDIISC